MTRRGIAQDQCKERKREATERRNHDLTRKEPRNAPLREGTCANTQWINRPGDRAGAGVHNHDLSRSTPDNSRAQKYQEIRSCNMLQLHQHHSATLPFPLSFFLSFCLSLSLSLSRSFRCLAQMSPCTTKVENGRCPLPFGRMCPVDLLSQILTIEGVPTLQK